MFFAEISNMKEELLKIREEAVRELKEANPESLEELRTRYLGKKGIIKEMLGRLGNLSVDDKKEFGRAANELKDEIGLLFDAAQKTIEKKKRDERLKSG